MKCASETWKEVFVVNELSFEIINDSCTIAKDVLKYPEQVREFLENGYWWDNGGGEEECARPGKSFDFGPNLDMYFNPLGDQLRKFYDVEEVLPIEIYGNCLNGNMDLYTVMSYVPHVDTFPGDFTNHNPRNDVAFNINLTKSDKVKTAFYSFNDKRSVCDFTANDYGDLKTITKNQKSIITKGKWKESGENEYENYKLEYVADIDYNSMILYPSHYWHNAYLKEDWFIDEDRLTFTGFFELIK